MKTIRATYRVVTPMFCGGADPMREAELRLPSFKGVLRFWWRALAWSEVQDVVELSRREAVLFGSSEVGQSRVLFRLEKPVASTSKLIEPWPRAGWQQYSGYGLRDKGERCFIPPGAEWNVVANLARCDDAQAAQVVAAMKLLGLAGGLGSRARKAWGSVTLCACDGMDWACPRDAAAWLAASQAIFPATPPTTGRFTAVTRETRWNAGPPQPDAKGAQQWLAQRYRDHVKETQPKGDRAQFGLPRLFGKGTRSRPERRASPLFLHVHACGDNRALPCALWLPADFLPDEMAMPGRGESARHFVESLNSAP